MIPLGQSAVCQLEDRGGLQRNGLARRLVGSAIGVADGAAEDLLAEQPQELERRGERQAERGSFYGHLGERRRKTPRFRADLR